MILDAPILRTGFMRYEIIMSDTPDATAEAGRARVSGVNPMVFKANPDFQAEIDLEMTGACVSHSRTDATARDVTQPCDEPEARGGTNMGLTPTETLWSALLGCTNVIGNRIAKRHGMKIDDMALKVDYTFDRRGAALIEPVSVPFTKALLTITVTSDADEETVAKVQRDLDLACPIFQVIRQSGCDIKSKWVINRP